MADDKGDEEPQKKKKMERQKCYFALHVSVAHFAPISDPLDSRYGLALKHLQG
jgi:hypothetical protein